MTVAILQYLLIGFLFALFASCRGRADIPWYAFVVTVFVWPYTLYLATKGEP